MPWCDGALHDTSRVPFDLADRGLLLGDGVFDTSLVLDGRMVWRAAHIARLEASCRVLGFVVDASQIEAAIDAVLNGVQHASLRVSVTRGVGPRGVAPPKDPTPVIFAATTALRAEALFAPVKLHQTAIRRNETSPAARVKSLSYLDSVLAAREALEAGCDDALFMNVADNLACTAIGNVFVLIGDQIVTPPVEDGVIGGIARAMVLRAAEEVGLEAIERSVSHADLDRAERAVVTNSLRLVAPVVSIGRRELGSSSSRRVQALIAHVAAIVRDETGVDPRRLAGG